MRQNLVEQKFERLLVIGEAGTDKNRHLLWLCRCVCGVEKVVLGGNLRSGKTKSCGCLSRQLSAERLTTHGKSGTPEYAAWKDAKERCTNSNNPYYAGYGGRGIKFLFDSFEEFLACTGPRPGKKYSLDRINNDGHYEPGNIRWATIETQSRNKRSNRWLTYKNESLCIAAWAKKLGLGPAVIRDRLNLGWSVEKTLTTPVRAMARTKRLSAPGNAEAFGSF